MKKATKTTNQATLATHTKTLSKKIFAYYDIDKLLFGSTAAIFIHQLDYWIKHPNPDIGTLFDEKRWIRNTYEEWFQQVDAPSHLALQKCVNKLERLGIVLSRRDNRCRNVKYYTLNYERLERYRQSANHQSLHRHIKEKTAKPLKGKRQYIPTKLYPIERYIDIWEATFGPIETPMDDLRLSHIIKSHKDYANGSMDWWERYCQTLATFKQDSPGWTLTIDDALKFSFLDAFTDNDPNFATMVADQTAKETGETTPEADTPHPESEDLKNTREKCLPGNPHETSDTDGNKKNSCSISNNTTLATSLSSPTLEQTEQEKNSPGQPPQQQGEFLKILLCWVSCVGGIDKLTPKTITYLGKAFSTVFKGSLELWNAYCRQVAEENKNKPKPMGLDEALLFANIQRLQPNAFPLWAGKSKRKGTQSSKQNTESAKRMLDIFLKAVGGPIPTLTNKRIGWCRKALYDAFSGSYDEWGRYCWALGSSAFLTGRVNHFHASFEWALTFTNIAKVREGAYQVKWPPTKEELEAKDPVRMRAKVRAAIDALDEPPEIKEIRKKIFYETSCNSRKEWEYQFWVPKVEIEIHDGIVHLITRTEGHQYYLRELFDTYVERALGRFRYRYVVRPCVEAA